MEFALERDLDSEVAAVASHVDLRPREFGPGQGVDDLAVFVHREQRRAESPLLRTGIGRVLRRPQHPVGAHSARPFARMAEGGDPGKWITRVPASSTRQLSKSEPTCGIEEPPVGRKRVDAHQLAVGRDQGVARQPDGR